MVENSGRRSLANPDTRWSVLQAAVACEAFSRTLQRALQACVRESGRRFPVGALDQSKNSSPDLPYFLETGRL